MKKEDFCNQSQSDALRKLGYNWSLDNGLIPLYEAMKFLYKVKGYDIDTFRCFTSSNNSENGYTYSILFPNKTFFIRSEKLGCIQTREDASRQAITKVLLHIHGCKV